MPQVEATCRATPLECDTYTRDGFGSEFVAVAPPDINAESVPWRDPDCVSMTGALAFDGDSLHDALATKQVRSLASDPHRDDVITLAGRHVPLAANFNAA